MKDKKIIIGLVVLQLLLCLPVLNLFPVSLDEPFSIFHAQFPLEEMIPEISKGNNSPLHFILLNFWVKSFGVGAFAVRCLSLVFSLLGIIYLYRLGRKFWSPNYAVLVVGLFMFSRLNHYVAMEARMYGLFTLFFILILYEFHRLLFENKKVYLFLGLWNALLLYTHYLGGVVILMECIVFLAYYKHWNKQKWIQVGLTVGVGLLLFIPGISVFLDRASDFKTEGSWVPDVSSIDLWTNFVKLMNNQFTVFTTSGIILLLFVLGKKYYGQLKDTKITYFALWFFGGYLLMFVLSLVIQPIFFIKYLQFLSIPLFFLCVASVAHFQFTGLKKQLPFVILLPFLISFKPVPDVDRDTGTLVGHVRANQTDATLIYYCPPHYNLTLAYHYDQTIFSNIYEIENEMEKEGFRSIYDGAGVLPENGIDRVIYIDFDSKLLYTENGILEKLDSTFIFSEVSSFMGDFHVYIYSAK